jgi:hypothetical protein
MMKRLNLLSCAIVILTGCAGTHATDSKASAPTVAVYRLVLNNFAQAPIATGQIELPLQLPNADGSFTGHWHLMSDGGNYPELLRDGNYSAVLSNGIYSFNLNPGMADNNVMLKGILVAGDMTGRWTYSTLADGRNLGTFSMTLQDTRKPGS